MAVCRTYSAYRRKKPKSRAMNLALLCRASGTLRKLKRNSQVILIYWLIRHKLVNRVSSTPRDLWLSIAIWIGTIAVRALLLL